VQVLEGTHKLEEPVSKITLKVYSGVPISTGPKYYEAMKLEIFTVGQESAKTMDF
jgi:hypothetical protein